MEARFKVTYLEDANEFLSSLPPKIREKILYNISKSQYVIDKKLFEKLTETIWEFRTAYLGNSYRLLAFWDNEEGAFVIATHGFMKKTQKTPPNEITKADKIRQKYFNDKNLQK